MIRNKAEYKEAVTRLEAERLRMAEHRLRPKKEGLTPAQVKRAFGPVEVLSFAAGRRGPEL